MQNTIIEVLRSEDGSFSLHTSMMQQKLGLVTQTASNKYKGVRICKEDLSASISSIDDVKSISECLETAYQQSVDLSSASQFCTLLSAYSHRPMSSDTYQAFNIAYLLNILKEL